MNNSRALRPPVIAMCAVFRVQNFEIQDHFADGKGSAMRTKKEHLHDSSQKLGHNLRQPQTMDRIPETSWLQSHGYIYHLPSGYLT